MYHYMEKAEIAADQISKIYHKASGYLSSRAEKIFEKFRSRYGLSESEARQLLSQIKDKASLDELLQKLRSGVYDVSKQELLKLLEAPAYQARIERLEQIQNQLDILMKSVYQQEKDFTTSFYTDLANESYYRGIFNIQQQADAAFSFAHVSAKVIDRVVGSHWSGKNYSDRIWHNTQGLAEALKEELLINFITGRSDREAAEIIANKFAQGASNARRLVRTESNYVATEMNFEAYEACGIEKYQYLATLDLQTSEICRELDGKIFPVKEKKRGENCPPMHPWCRSTTISVVNEEWIKDMQRSAIDPATGKRIKVPRSMTYQQWYDKYVKGKPEAETEEKKIKNRSSDRQQFGRYQRVLGDDAPKTLDEFQDMKYNEPEKWDYMKLDYQRRNTLIQHPELELPNAENATAAEAKFTKYLFDGEHPRGLAKGEAFTSRLGYNINNWQELRKEILSSAVKYPSTLKGDNGHGRVMYEQKIILQGMKGLPANVVVGWATDVNGTAMASAYIKEVK